MDLFRITGLLVDQSQPDPSRDFAPRYGWRQATARWLGESAAAAREALDACRAVAPCPACTDR
jgi:hypothetical protein